MRTRLRATVGLSVLLGTLGPAPASVPAGTRRSTSSPRTCALADVADPDLPAGAAHRIVAEPSAVVS